MPLTFKRIYVRRYRDNDTIVAYAEHNRGRTEGVLGFEGSRRHGYLPAFGPHMHALFAAARSQGLHLERETW